MKGIRWGIVVCMLGGAWATTGCDSSGVNTEAEARRAYLGLDLSIERSLNLGMTGYNEANSANIPEQTGAGDATGTMTVNGQVDQGSSPNKEMRLLVALVDYSDGTIEDTVNITYDTDPNLPIALDLSLRDIPNGTFTGTFVGDVTMSGDLDGSVTLNLTFAGEIEPDPNDAMRIQRVVGTTTITGTATSDYGTYNISLTR